MHSLAYSGLRDPKILVSHPRWVVVDKPSGWLTIPGRSDASVPILLDWVKTQFPAVWVVHRLDRETSGVVLFARSAEDHALANAWFAQRSVKKTYYCLAQGIPEAPFFKVQQPIEGAASTTQVEVVERFQHSFLARVFPRTGRRHQIRIHLAARGNPILGDALYGGKTQLEAPVLSISRVALHAGSLELPTGDRFESPWPEDFMAWLEMLR